MKKLIGSVLLFATFGTAFGEKVKMRGATQLMVGKNGEPIGLILRRFDDNEELNRAGVEIGDVMVNICGQKLNSALDFLKGDASMRRSSDPCEIHVIRNGEKMTFIFQPKN